ncbi:MAG: N-sulfoglucosamine sulfohydrolase, partial [Rhodothermales bacterium]
GCVLPCLSQASDTFKSTKKCNVQTAASTVKPGQVSNDLVMSIDICATIFEAAGIKPDVPLHGKSLFSAAVKPRKYIFAARDKMDETHDAMRAIRSKNHKLILNLMPERPWCQFNRYKEGSYPVLAEMNIMHMKGQLTPAQALFFAPSKPEVELFDLQRDPHEINNLADDANFAETKATLLAGLDHWRKNVIDDQGVSVAFRAKDAFPASCPVAKVDDWVQTNAANYDFNTLGWPAWYPTRTLDEWEKARATWEPYVMRGPHDAMSRPNVVHSKRKTPKKRKKKK